MSRPIEFWRVEGALAYAKTIDTWLLAANARILRGSMTEMAIKNFCRDLRRKLNLMIEYAKV